VPRKGTDNQRRGIHPDNRRWVWWLTSGLAGRLAGSKPRDKGRLGRSSGASDLVRTDIVSRPPPTLRETPTPRHPARNLGRSHAAPTAHTRPCPQNTGDVEISRPRKFDGIALNEHADESFATAASLASRACRSQKAVEPAQNGERQNYLAVFIALVRPAEQVADAPDKAAGTAEGT
jgi:hypothetical protein